MMSRIFEMGKNPSQKASKAPWRRCRSAQNAHPAAAGLRVAPCLLRTVILSNRSEVPPSGGTLNPNLISETGSSVMIRVFHEVSCLRRSGLNSITWTRSDTRQNNTSVYAIAHFPRNNHACIDIFYIIVRLLSILSIGLPWLVSDSLC